MGHVFNGGEQQSAPTALPSRSGKTRLTTDLTMVELRLVRDLLVSKTSFSR